MPGTAASGVSPQAAAPGAVLGKPPEPSGKTGLLAVFSLLLKDKPDPKEKKETKQQTETGNDLPPPPPGLTFGIHAEPISLPNAGKKAGKSDAMDTVQAKPGSELSLSSRRELPLQSQPIKPDTLTRLQQAVGHALDTASKRSSQTSASPLTADIAPNLPSTLAPTLATIPPMPQGDRAQMVQQITDGVSAIRAQALPGGQGRMTLQLHPKDWGQIQVSVTITPTHLPDGAKSSTVVAHVDAQNPSVKAALEGHLPELRSALRSAGMHLERMTVSVQSVAAGSPGAAAGGHHFSPGGGSGGFGQQHQSQADAPTTGRNANAGMSSFASFAGQQPNHRQGGQSPPSAAPTTFAADEREPETPEISVARPTAGHLDLRV